MMPACVDRQLLLQGLFDGELDSANAAEAEAHLASCRDCRDEYRRLQSVRQALSGDGVRYWAPESLQRRVAAAIDSGSPNGRSRIPTWLAAGFTGALAASLALLLFIPSGEQSSLDRELIAGHVRSLEVQHLTDIQTSNQHVVRPWFNGKIDFSPPVPELASTGFPLAGGRFDYIHGRPVPALVYHRRLHTINLFIWPQSGAPARSVNEDGYALNEWSDGGLRYAAVSDISPAELEQFHQAFERAAKG
jgi:anti-sigma factor RsiW